MEPQNNYTRVPRDPRRNYFIQIDSGAFRALVPVIHGITGKGGQDSLGAGYSSGVQLCGNVSMARMISVTDSGSLVVVVGLQMEIFSWDWLLVRILVTGGW
ncbi:hypothetical protein CDAR_433331 [Caerostris darwini]|uniref:VQ domain-containing protein n=1 Tax=Caerostris darwini TaxID=1538125 RepID=A0AAV4QMD6_9ARAC|nr:hypothetical protein CDAR_433331 [Caerostris darwini]